MCIAKSLVYRATPLDVNKLSAHPLSFHGDLCTNVLFILLIENSGTCRHFNMCGHLIIAFIVCKVYLLD